ncbi:MAG: GAF domain-containing sensor histidine kinase [Comamonadaceae bacterium]|nr:MAG: GAF domain-containing sensor histidine kinase [Comamonadaceae bacterium]
MSEELGKPGEPIPEARRLDALDRLQVMDTGTEAVFDDVVLLASQICGAPIALISMVDADRQWFKAKVGLEAQQTPREQAFCAHAIVDVDEVMTVEDASSDPRFAANPLVTGNPHIRFYAGAPIVLASGEAMGTVCVIDQRPRTLDDTQKAALRALARQTAHLLESRAAALASRAQARTLEVRVTEALTAGDPQGDELRKRQRLMTVGQMTSGIAHDFNNLLQSISGWLELIRRQSKQPARVEKWAASALDAVRSAGELAAQLLSVARHKEPDFKPLAIGAAISRMEPLLRRAVGPEIALSFELKDTARSALADPAQLEAAVLNLALNARDAMNARGKLVISVQTVQASSADDALTPGDYLVVSVEDNGPGMPTEVAARAFEPFFTTKGDNKGSGLGLAQVKGFALLSAGTANIHTLAGHGTRVEIWLKVAQPDGSASEPAASPLEPAGSAARRGGRVLLVEDDERVRDAMGQLLTEEGYQVAVAHDAASGIREAEQFEPDVILTDFAMAGLNGADMADLLEKLSVAVPVIFITGHADVERLVPLLRPGATVLRKPLALHDLVVAIEKVIRASTSAP